MFEPAFNTVSDILKAHPQSCCSHTVKNASNQGGANSVTAAAALWHTTSQRRMLVASKAAFLENYKFWQLALGFLMDLQLNATRRSINLSVYLVFDLEAGQFKFLGENLLGTGASENELSTLDSFS